MLELVDFTTDLCVSVKPLKPTIASSVSPNNQQEDEKTINLTCQYGGTMNVPDPSYMWFTVDNSGQSTPAGTGIIYQPVISLKNPTSFECQVINPHGSKRTNSDRYNVTGKVIFFLDFSHA